MKSVNPNDNSVQMADASGNVQSYKLPEHQKAQDFKPGDSVSYSNGQISKVLGQSVNESVTEESSKELKARLEDLIAKNNKEHGTNFQLSGAYGNTELWANDKKGAAIGGSRLEAGSVKDCYEAFVKARFNEKYKVKGVEEGVNREISQIIG